MANFPGGKIDGASTLSAEEWNQTLSFNNLINSSGQTPSSSDLTQIAKAIATYSACSDFYTDSGTTNAYILTPIDDLESPASYKNGMRIRFRAGNGNTGASTVNVNSIGQVDLKAEDGVTDLVQGQISISEESEFRYNGSVFVKITKNPLPTGAIITFGSSSAPSGFLLCNGAEVAIATYTDLTNAIYIGDVNNANTNYVFGYKTDGAGNRSTSGTHIKIPDLRGEFVRGWDNGRGVDSGRVFGSSQSDAMQGHHHSYTRASFNETANHFDSDNIPSGIPGTQYTTTQNILDPISDGTNGTPRTAAETRPRNIAVNYIIKY